MCAAAILVPAALADVALQCCFDRVGIVLGKLYNSVEALVIVLCQCARQNSAYLDGYARVPMLWRWRLFFQMGVPHLLYKFVAKRRAACQQFIDADCQRILVGVASWIPLPLLRRHIRSCTGDLSKRGMCLHAEIECRAEV